MDIPAWSEQAPRTARQQIETLLAGFLNILDTALVGLYLHGSLAMGGFNAQRSDIDLLAVCVNPLSVETKRRLIDLLLLASRSPHPVEISFLHEAQLTPWEHPAPYDLHFSEQWRDSYMLELADGSWQDWNSRSAWNPNLAAHITVIRKRGVCLYGKSISDVFPEVPAAHYLDSILADFAWARDVLERRGGTAKNAVYLVMNACRIFAYLQEGKILSKAEGAMWALRSLTMGMGSVVQQALDIQWGNAPESAFDPVQLRRFFILINSQIRARTG